jgi:hypothetical protein
MSAGSALLFWGLLLSWGIVSARDETKGSILLWLFLAWRKSGLFGLIPSFSQKPRCVRIFSGEILPFCGTTCMAGFVLVRDWDRLSTLSAYTMGLSVVVMLAFWCLALQGYREIHDRIHAY